jgi:nucleotide-binding universal stress UspA family protein
MTAPILLCADGSDLALGALRAGLGLIDATAPITVVTVVEPDDPGLVTGAGMAGGVMSPETYVELSEQRLEQAHALVADAAAALGRSDAATVVLSGSPGPAICEYADEVSARAIVIGTRGRGGFKRALLGSVSDHIIRNAGCPVVVSTAT